MLGQGAAARESRMPPRLSVRNPGSAGAVPLENRKGIRMLCPMKKLRALGILGLWLLAPACGTDPPPATTDLFLIDLWADTGLVRVGEPRNLTRREGYDNQPSWSADGRSILYASRSGAGSDVYRFDLDADRAVRVTDTEDKEFSPQQMPRGDGVTAVRLERDDSLRVWRFDADGQNPAPLLPAFREAVRYYTWIDEDTLALSVGDREPALHIAHIQSGQVDHVADNVGRSINLRPGKRAISFVLRETPADWWIAELDLESGTLTRLVRTLQGVEDHAWTPSGKCLMATGSRLYSFVPGESDGWLEIADFAHADLLDITRLAVSPDGNRIVVASEVRAR